MIKKIFNFITGENKKKPKDTLFDTSKNTDDAIIRSINSVRLLKTKISNLKDLVKYTYPLPKEQREENDTEILNKVDLVNAYISTIHSLALNIVNNPKYKQTSLKSKQNHPNGNDLNLNFLSIMNLIKSKNLSFDNKNLNRHTNLIEKITEIEKLLNEIKIL